MSMFRHGYVAGPLLGLLWALVIATTTAVVFSFATGGAYRPGGSGAGLLGAGGRDG